MKYYYFLTSIATFVSFSCSHKPETIYIGKNKQTIYEKILRIENALLPATKFVTGEKLAAPIKFVPRSRQHAIKLVP